MEAVKEQRPELCTNARPTRKRKRKHVPHSQRPLEFVEKRNGRERKRVDNLNLAFESLKDRLPYITRRTVRTSKVKILTNAISYIKDLSSLLNEHDECHGSNQSFTPSHGHSYDTCTSLNSSMSSCPQSVELFEERIPSILDDNLNCTEAELPANSFHHFSGTSLNRQNYNDQTFEYFNDMVLSYFSSEGARGTLTPSLQNMNTYPENYV